MHQGSELVIPAMLTYMVICEAIIYSIAPSNAKRVFRIGSFSFTFWERSWGLLGLVVGHILTVIVFTLFKGELNFNAVLWVFIGYALLCVTIAMLLGRTGYKLPEKSYSPLSMKEVCGLIKEDYSLTARELEVLELVGEGRSLPYVQDALCIAPSTAATHIDSIYKKLGVHKRQELISLIQKYKSLQADM
jgi:DNA-binding CsgD family transcriptional regulator